MAQKKKSRARRALADAWTENEKALASYGAGIAKDLETFTGHEYAATKTIADHELTAAGPYLWGSVW